ncbi:segregation and condensation protein A [Saliphagus infecundisoli]|uniref:Segregation/condensation protein A n=1 Tax=Saliphagus infecundisoli TaxID=1849069 RepID=A0ABD5QBY9_9EURY|nr:ScpA family protein [Saliphagus infecundisoli]
MTREPRSGSNRPSGEGTEPRERESRSDSSKSSGERSEPRERKWLRADGSGRPDDTTGEDADDSEEIPLSIAGHEEREPPGEGTALEFDAGSEESETEGKDADGEDVEPVELLVSLAKEGEIDPWDIDIVRVTDRFLSALDEADLRTSGRALFYASVLLRMKSDVLFDPDEPDEEELPPWEAPMGGMEGGEPADAGGFDPVERLEAEMDRRLERKQARGSPETLDELVRELRDAERGSWWKESRTYDTSDSPQGYSRGTQELSYHSGDDLRVDEEPTADDVTHTAHGEDIEDVIEDVEGALETQYERGRSEVLFAEIAEVGGSRVMSYLAVLFLAHRGRLHLDQDELFGDLWVQQAPTEADPEEAIAG